MCPQRLETWAVHDEVPPWVRVVIHASSVIRRSPNRRLCSVSGKMFIHASINSVSYHLMIMVGSQRILFIVESPSVMILPFMLIAH